MSVLLEGEVYRNALFRNHCLEKDLFGYIDNFSYHLLPRWSRCVCTDDDHVGRVDLGF